MWNQRDSEPLKKMETVGVLQNERYPIGREAQDPQDLLDEPPQPILSNAFSISSFSIKAGSLLDSTTEWCAFAAKRMLSETPAPCSQQIRLGSSGSTLRAISFAHTLFYIGMCTRPIIRRGPSVLGMSVMSVFFQAAGKVPELKQ